MQPSLIGEDVDAVICRLSPDVSREFDAIKAEKREALAAALKHYRGAVRYLTIRRAKREEFVELEQRYRRDIEGIEVECRKQVRELVESLSRPASPETQRASPSSSDAERCPVR